MSEYDDVVEVPSGVEETEEPLPPDIEAVWGGGRLDGLGEPAARTARALIAAWGLEVFRGSALHRRAVEDASREARLAPVRRAFVERRRKA